MDSIIEELSGYMTRNYKSTRLEDENGELVVTFQSSGSLICNSSPIKLSKKEWEDYFKSAARDDDHPISLMAVHLDEAVTSASEHGMQNFTIIYDGSFAPAPAKNEE